MDFLPLDPTVPQEVDPPYVMLDIAGFNNAQANRIRADGFDSIDDMGIDVLEEQDIKDLASTFSRMPATSRISFGIARTKRLIRMMHWVQDHERMRCGPHVRQPPVVDRRVRRQPAQSVSENTVASPSNSASSTKSNLISSLGRPNRYFARRTRRLQTPTSGVAIFLAISFTA